MELLLYTAIFVCFVVTGFLINHCNAIRSELKRYENRCNAYKK